MANTASRGAGAGGGGGGVGVGVGVAVGAGTGGTDGVEKDSLWRAGIIADPKARARNCSSWSSCLTSTEGPVATTDGAASGTSDESLVKRP